MNISHDIFQTHPTVPFHNVVTKHRPVVQCVRGKHQRVVASAGRLRVGGLGWLCAASCRPIEIADADAHDNYDIGRSCVAVARRGSSAIRISSRMNRRPISFHRAGSVRVRRGSSRRGALSDASAKARAPPLGRIIRDRRPSRVRPSRGDLSRRC